MKSLFTITIMVLFTMMVNGQDQYFELVPKIDGNSTDWSNQETSLDDKTGFITGARNDSQFLYLIFKSNKPSTINKAMQAGMTLSLKAKTKPKLNAKLDFPLPGERTQFNGQQRGGNGGGGQNPSEREARRNELMTTLLASKTEAKLKGFTKTEGTLQLEELEGIQLALNVEGEGQSRTFNYEVSIPLSELFGEGFMLAELTSIPLEIEFDVKAVSAPQQGGDNPGFSSTSGGRGGAGGGGRGGAPRGGAPTGGPTGEMYSSQSVKIEYILKSN
ncbi:MAG TPA: hypothetical protein VIN11_04210 [Roseivirga sp.]